MNQGSIWGRLLKKTRGRQSRATVPLTGHQLTVETCTWDIGQHWTRDTSWSQDTGHYVLATGLSILDTRIEAAYWTKDPSWTVDN